MDEKRRSTWNWLPTNDFGFTDGTTEHPHVLVVSHAPLYACSSIRAIDSVPITSPTYRHVERVRQLAARPKIAMYARSDKR
ncbi:hypothetical protein BC938DRAFT_471671 [Jimgerdemannia flammicorona]|uniref:Uncharacterized protein n=1 Tax=Jimgerdemannia flammicorona TaxID=994334 RepID=A0A433Q7N3_9FUNG|nr:hypothetical protein BC938DRAFT_471671 [Jimgerdemannia flammicorona]